MPRGEKIISEIAKRTEQFNILNYKFPISGTYKDFVWIISNYLF
jgi:hypothetical protein